MPDNKYRGDNDKIGYLGIEKYRIIDLLENVQELPDTGIYDEPVRYFKANLKWTPIIFGWLTIIQEIAGWQIADDDNYRGMQEIRIFEEGIEPIMTTPLELQTAITEGIYDAVNDIAKQIVTGVRADFTVDADGNVVPPGAPDVPLPEDDPATVIDESKAARAGGVLAVATGIIDFYAQLETLYGPADPDPDTTLADAIFLITSTFICKETMPSQITDFYLERSAGNDYIVAMNNLSLAGYLYCHNFGSMQDTIRKFIVTSSSIGLPAKKRMVALLDALSQENFDLWFEAGSKVPSSVYADFPCEPIPDEEIILSVGEVKDTNGIAKINHRYLIKTQGVLVDPDGDIQDTWYYKAVGESPVFGPGLFNITSTGFTSDPTAAQVPYRADHRYEWTIERDDNHVLHLQWTKAPDMDLASTGLLTVNIHDLGSFV